MRIDRAAPGPVPASMRCAIAADATIRDRILFKESIMMKFLLWAVIIIFVIGLLVVSGLFSLIF
ncbi:hypothetical protein IM543_06450 [Massilia sp. UMI-21]|nr:hypothetical protein IM543_06450 [Massilia sp. UMI-21]